MTEHNLVGNIDFWKDLLYISSGAEQKCRKWTTQISHDYIFLKFKIIEYYIMWILQFYLWMFIVDSSVLIMDENNYEGIMRINFIHKIVVLIPVSVIKSYRKDGRDLKLL